MESSVWGVVMITLKNISYTTNSNEKILDDINLNIKKGEFVVITGKSGSGKTTLASVINGLISHTYEGTLTGEAYINGENINDLELSQISNKVGTVFQDPRSQFFMTDPFNEVAFGLSNMRLNKDEIKRRVENSLKVFGIEHLKEKSIFKLSSGEKQKVAIASCYAMEPDIYLFNEPTANLDIQSIFDLRDILKELKKFGKTIVVLEHRLFYLPNLLDRMIVIRDGKIEREFSKKTLLDVQNNCQDIRSLYLNDLTAVNYTKPNVKENPILEVKKISYSHSKQEKNDVLKDISITAFGNEIIGIIGENGVGKTTFARVCSGLLKEKDGNIFVEGKKYTHKKRLGKVYFVMQDSDFQLFTGSVEEELSIGKSGAMLTDEEKNTIMSRFEILNFKDRHPMTLSRGQKQRLTIAVATTSESKIIFFDEPTSGLDKNSMDLVSQSILEISDKNKVLFVISHDYEFLLSVCNRIIYLKNGSVNLDFKLNSDTESKLWELLSKGR
ncbi:cobalt transport ATP-binding protein cbiO [Streptococcus pyogenes]|uniref:ABC transporter ATP-binding protein n=2 Tax=Streptococcus pyogenes TaxID=1314 RepID=UPI0010D427BC|nr:energy-coupling factor ABC transporter ATP-binding protein [Streptococcus pyogenes]VGQ30184.1 cobalt transport ATP-binding protein cbiO [Streptococcus pyogenes]VGQ69487.1 cobalt transport ATP-binding protein cbiO [Streptococcus pyogenes]VGR07867.1 cobalt transport ATP-binding protein cbiO [Streptococcus pyogenes]VGV04541.1 cobalt transport ATP-binding protein cbiO [Streptococcus pyogenes]VGV49045.1 cobalt transport ATP-binding protein cbiO [Streptococcus pyogenes]